jgi:glutamine amidotransferase
LTKKRVVVLDYGSGNIRSAVRALERAGAEVELTADRSAAEAADGLVVPGVGAFAACMAGLRGVDGPRSIGRRLAGARPVLGICVGMQVLFERGVEHGVETDGCDEWPGTVERLEAPVVPHMGWNTVEVPEGSTLFAGVEHERFYFVHYYAARSWDLRTD